MILKQQRQIGAVLVISLIVLLLLTLLGLSSFQLIGSDTAMTRNVQDNGYAFQVAESVLIEAENRLIGDPPELNELNFPDNGNGFYVSTANNAPSPNQFPDGGAVLSAGYRAYGANNASNAYYIIIHSVDPTAGDQYLVSVMAQGRLGTTQVVLQSTLGNAPDP